MQEAAGGCGSGTGLPIPSLVTGDPISRMLQRGPKVAFRCEPEPPKGWAKGKLYDNSSTNA